MVNRLITNVCEIPSEKIKSGQLASYEWQQLDYKLKDLLDAPLYVDDTPSLSVFELRTKARRLVREHGVRIIIIDYLQLMNASGMAFGSRQEEVSTISRSLKGLAKELNIPIIALSQLNRGVESREGIDGKRPQLSDLRESGAIEQDADMVCFIHRPEYYKIYQDDRGNDLRGMAEIVSLPFATTLPSTTRAGSAITLYSIIFIKSSSLVITASKANSFTTCSTVAYRALQPAQPVPNTLISIIYKFIILNVIRKTTNINIKKRGLSATLPRFTDTLPEKLLKEFTSQLPILSVDTVFHFRRFNLSLYKSCIFQLFQVL